MTQTTFSRYAVCPRIERSGSGRTPRLFASEAAAKEFLDSEVCFPGEAELDRQRAAASKNGEAARAASGFALTIRNRDQGWRNPVPVRRAADYSGPACNRAMRDFLPAEAVGPLPALNLEEEIDRSFQGRSADYACCLHTDWRFDEIEADAWRRAGHEYSGRPHASVAEIVVRAVHDLEAAFRKFHPNASCAAVADFWRSWQVQRHIADFCAGLAESETARMLAGDSIEAGRQAECARVHVCRQLAAFAHEVLDGAFTPELAGSAVMPEAGTDEPARENLPAPSKGEDRRALAEARRALVDSFIEKVSPKGEKRIAKAEIWRAAGYKDRRQFCYWQAAHPKAGKMADKNFRRILMNPAEFLARRKK